MNSGIHQLKYLPKVCLMEYLCLKYSISNLLEEKSQ